MIGFFLGNWQRGALYGLLAAAVSALLIGYGYHRGVQKLWEYQAAQAREAVRIVTKRGEVTERVVYRYVKVKGETQTVTNTIEKEVLRYVETNHGSCLDARWRGLHDAAAANTVPVPESHSDGAGGAPTAAAALQTVTENYANHHACADRLDALQAWVREQQQVR